MRDCCGYVCSVLLGAETELLIKVNVSFCTNCDFDHSLECFYRIFTCSSFTGKHDRTCSLIDRVGNVCGLCTCRTRVFDHGIQHLSSCDNLFSRSVYFGNDILLDNRNILKRDLNTHVTTGDHDTVSYLNDAVDVVNTLLVLDLGDDLDVLSTVFLKDITDFFDIGCCSGERSGNEIIAFFDTKQDIVVILRADEWHVYFYTRKVDTFLIAENTTVYYFTDNVLTFDLLNFKSDQTVIDQNAVARFDILI